MPQIAAMSINDGQVTPVAHTFSVIRPQNGDKPSEFRDLTNTVQSQRLQIYAQLRKAVGNQTRDKVLVTAVVPLVRTNTSGVAEAVDNATFRGEFTLPDICTGQERKDLAAYAANVLDIAQIRGMVTDLLELY